MVALLQKLAAYIVNWFLTKGIDRLIQWWTEKDKAEERERINQANRDRLNQAVQEGKPDAEISQSIEDVLNRNKR